MWFFYFKQIKFIFSVLCTREKSNLLAVCMTHFCSSWCLSVCLFAWLSIYLNVCLSPPVFPPSLPKMLILPESWELRAEAWKIKIFFCSWWKTDFTYFLVRKSCKNNTPLTLPTPKHFLKKLFKIVHVPWSLLLLVGKCPPPPLLNSFYVFLLHLT